MLSKFSKRLIFISSVVALAILLGIAIGQTREKNDVLKGIDLFGETLFYVKNRYVEVVNDNKIFSGALQGLAENLDPESFFMEPDEYEIYIKSPSGLTQNGIGIGIIKLYRFLRVISVEPGSPADQAGIKVGDYITHIDGRSGFDISIFQAYGLLSGKYGTKVSVEVREADSGLDKKLTINRNAFQPAQPVFDTFSGKIQYISMKHFYMEDVKVLKDILKNPKGQQLIVDLRGNYFGSKDALIDALDFFIGEGALFIEGNPKQGFLEQISKPDKIQLSSPLILIVDESTCHFAELFSAVLSEKKMAVLYGSPTKGLIGIQTANPIQKRGALYLTTEIFKTPGGSDIYLKGLKPDIEINIDSDTLEKAKPIKSDNGSINKKDPVLEKTILECQQKPQ